MCPTDLVFIENQGQWDTNARFVARLGSAAIALKDDAIDLIETGAGGFLVRLRFEGARRPRFVAEDPVATRYSYFLGSDPERWRSCVPAYRSILYRGQYDGVDVRIRSGGGDGLVAYDVLLAPGADLDAVRIIAEGADAMSVDDGGGLILRVGERVVRQSPPRAWETFADGVTRNVNCVFTKHDARTYGFLIPGRDASAALIVDPGLEWSTYLGGADSPATENTYAVDLSDDGSVTVAGRTGASMFPVTPGAFDTTFGGGGGTFPSDAFVVRLDPKGQALVFATYVGGIGNDEIRSLSVARDGVCLVGFTSSLDFPVTANAFDTTLGFEDAFITCLDASGSNLLHSTYLGGDGIESGGSGLGGGRSIRGFLGDNGIVTVASHTGSSDFPTTPDAISRTPFGLFNVTDIYVARVDTVRGGLLYSTYLGGSLSDTVHDAFVLGDRVAITGRTSSTDFMVTPNAFDATKNPSADAFVMVVDLAQNAVTYSSYLGSSYLEAGRAIALDEQGIVTIAGAKEFSGGIPDDFPITPGAFQQTGAGSQAVFVTRMDTNDGSLLYSTYLGGILANEPTDIVVQSSGAVTVVGHTSASNFPTTAGALLTTNPFRSNKAFVTRFQPDGSGLAYSTYLGGSEFEAVFFAACALDPSGSVVVSSETGSPDFPTTPSVFQPRLAGNGDVFVSKLDMLPAGVKRRGVSTPGCAGPLAIGVWGAPHPSVEAFAIDCTDAPPLTTRGFLVFSQAAAPGPLTIQGVRLYVDPAQVFAILPVSSNEVGHAVVPLRIPQMAVPFDVHVQFLWSDPCATGGWSATAALELAVPAP